MARPGFIHEVNERTPALAVHHGSGVIAQKFPLGTKVIYGPDPAQPRHQLRTSVSAALADPLGADALAAQLARAHRVSIVFSDTVAAVPPPQLADPRGQVIEEVLALAASHGVDDVALVCARGLNRRLSEAELFDALGTRVYESFAPLGSIQQHDATAETLVEVAGAKINKRVAESDLIITVNVTDNAHRAGAHIFAELSSEADLAGLRSSGPHADAENQLGARIAAALNVFAIDIAVDTHPFAEQLAFLGKREWEWSLKDKGIVSALGKAQKWVPARARARLMQDHRSVAAVLSVAAGAIDQVGAQTATVLRDHHRVEVVEPVDVLITGTGHMSGYGVGAWLNPLLSAHLALHDVYGSHTGTPLVKHGGSMIVFGGLVPRFHRHHMATADFVAEVLPLGTDPATLATQEERFAADEWYRHLYRESEAHHARQPFHLWAATAPARDALANIIWVGGGNRTMGALLGFRVATTLADALEMVGGRDAGQVAYVHNPPLALADVGGA